MCKELTESEMEMVITIHASPYSISQTTKKLRTEATNLETDVIKREMKASERGYSRQHIARVIREHQKDINEQIEFVEETGDKASFFYFFGLCMGRIKRSSVPSDRQG